jgi:hypothetical protein
MRKTLAGMALAVAAAATAHAEMAPEYYAAARDKAPDVITLSVTKVKAPFKSFGDCKVEGKVAAVERGTRYRPGQAIAITVPCMAPKANIPAGGTKWQIKAELKRSRQGRAWLEADGSLALYNYQIL